MPPDHTAASRGEPGQPARDEIRPRPSEGATVLCIEDNAANLALIETLFAERPHLSLLTEPEGLAGIETAQRSLPDLVLLDLHLPDLHGSQVLDRLRADASTREIPVVVVSADATPGVAERLLGAGAQDFLLKPFRVHEFWRTVDAALAGGRG